MNRSVLRRPGWVIGNTLFAAANLVLAVAWSWPIYADRHFLLMSAITGVVAGGIAIGGAIWRLGSATVAVISIAVLTVGAVPLAIPSQAPFGVLPSLEGLRVFATGTVTSWRELATVATLPVGGYRALLVPVYLTFFLTIVVGLSIALRSRRLGALGVFVSCLASVFGAVFGLAVGAFGSVAGMVHVAQAREILLGVCVFLVAVAWLAWRLSYQRRAKLTLVSPGARRARAVTLARRLSLGTAMLFIAIAFGAAAVASSVDNSRVVVRSSVVPVIDATTWTSPLSSFRSYFTDTNYNAQYFSVTGLSGDDRKVRLAVLDSYDGATFHVGQNADGELADRYQLLPGVRAPQGNGDEVTMTVTIDAYQGVWLPAVGEVTSVDFAGDSALDNAVYVGDSTGNVINMAARGSQALGVGAGDSYSYSGVQLVASDAEQSQTLADGAEADVTKETYPQLTEWRARLVAADYDLTTLAGASQAIELLTRSGFLSRGVDVLNLDKSAPAWTVGLPDPQASRAGHSTERIETLFSQLNESGEPLPAPADAGTATVNPTAIGDDEQFATAAALLFQSIGKQSRVVLGFVPEDGSAVYGRDMRAWVQVKLSDGTWADIDATPQSTVAPHKVTTKTNVEQMPTTVQPTLPDVEPPSQVDPAANSDTTASDRPQDTAFAWLRALIRPIAIALLVLVVLASGPTAIIVIKRSRRRERQGRADPGAAIIGGWDELVDRLADSGAVAALTETRRDVVRRTGTPEALAQIADRVAFSRDMPSSADSAAYWADIDAELERLLAHRTRWARLKYALSTTSFVRSIKAGRSIVRRS